MQVSIQEQWLENLQKKIVDGRTWTVRVDGKAYLVRFTSSFKGEVASKVPSRVNRKAIPDLSRRVAQVI
jgi:hypothetical protein